MGNLALEKPENCTCDLEDFKIVSALPTRKILEILLSRNVKIKLLNNIISV
jgi:hypothetical protein